MTVLAGFLLISLSAVAWDSRVPTVVFFLFPLALLACSLAAVARDLGLGKGRERKHKPRKTMLLAATICLLALPAIWAVYKYYGEPEGRLPC